VDKNLKDALQAVLDEKNKIKFLHRELEKARDYESAKQRVLGKVIMEGFDGGRRIIYVEVAGKAYSIHGTNHEDSNPDSFVREEDEVPEVIKYAP